MQIVSIGDSTCICMKCQNLFPGKNKKTKQCRVQSTQITHPLLFAHMATTIFQTLNLTHYTLWPLALSHGITQGQL